MRQLICTLYFGSWKCFHFEKLFFLLTFTISLFKLYDSLIISNKGNNAILSTFLLKYVFLNSLFTEEASMNIYFMRIFFHHFHICYWPDMSQCCIWRQKCYEFPLKLYRFLNLYLVKPREEGSIYLPSVYWRVVTEVGISSSLVDNFKMSDFKQ